MESEARILSPTPGFTYCATKYTFPGLGVSLHKIRLTTETNSLGFPEHTGIDAYT